MKTVEYRGEDNLTVMSSMTRYNRWIYETFSPYLGPNVFEAGCGNGNISRYVAQDPRIQRFVGVDLSKSFCEKLQKELGSTPEKKFEFLPRDLQELNAAEFSTQPFDSIVCSNVLEHIQNDLKLLNTFNAILKPGGHLLLQVPAFPWLFGSIDVIDHHYRRYTRQDLLPKLKLAGFKIHKAFYFNVLGIAAWIWHGKVLKLTTHRENELKWGDRIVPFLQKMESLIHPPIGLSLFAIAQKPNNSHTLNQH